MGMSATNSGVTPEPGISYVNQFLFYSRDRAVGPNGEVLATGQNSVMMDMGILPLQFPAGQNADSLKLTGEETFDITGIRDVVDKFAAGRTVKVAAKVRGKDPIEFEALVRIDTPQEALYYANGGILQYVLRQLLATKAEPVGA